MSTRPGWPGKRRPVGEGQPSRPRVRTPAPTVALQGVMQARRPSWEGQAGSRRASSGVPAPLSTVVPARPSFARGSEAGGCGRLTPCDAVPFSCVPPLAKESCHVRPRSRRNRCVGSVRHCRAQSIRIPPDRAACRAGVDAGHEAIGFGAEPPGFGFRHVLLYPLLWST